MPLLADAIRFSQPGSKLVVDLADVTEPKYVHVVSRRDCFDLPKSRTLQASREHHVTVEPLPPRCHLRERHSHLKGDPRLLGKDANWADAPDRGNDRVEERTNLGAFSLEMLFERVSSARV